MDLAPEANEEDINGIFEIDKIDGDLVFDKPTQCNPGLAVFEDVWRDRIVSTVATAYKYFMESRDPAAGNSYTERTKNFHEACQATFMEFANQRFTDYRAVRCLYQGKDWNKPGGASNAHIICQAGFELLPGTLSRTTNGDWKGGPTYNADNTQMTWRTGGHGRSETFAHIWSKYKDAAIPENIKAELNAVRSILNARDIPTNLPPLK
jgi:hypothetical protein